MHKSNNTCRCKNVLLQTDNSDISLAVQNIITAVIVSFYEENKLKKI